MTEESPYERWARCYIGFDALADSAGFSFTATDKSRTEAMGNEVPARRWKLNVRTPRYAKLRLLRDGRIVTVSEGDTLVCEVTQPGSYRVEAWLRARGRDRAWILSNPIYLRAAKSPGATGGSLRG